jgi:hypothetical protein
MPVLPGCCACRLWLCIAVFLGFSARDLRLGGVGGSWEDINLKFFDYEKETCYLFW